MKHLAAAGAAMILAAAAPASAQLIDLGTIKPGTPVIDLTAIARIGDAILIAKSQLDSLIKTEQQTFGILNSVNGLVDGRGWAPLLNTAGLRDPMPFGSSAMPGYVGGFSAPTGGFGQTFLNQNTLGGSLASGNFNDDEIRRMVWAISSIQGAVASLSQAAQQRVAELPKISDQLSSADTLQKVSAVNSRINGEHAIAQTQLQQAQTLDSQARLQMAAFDAVQRQRASQDDVAGIAAMCTSAGSLGITGTIPACSAEDSTGGGSGLVTTSSSSTSGPAPASTSLTSTPATASFVSAGSAFNP